MAGQDEQDAAELATDVRLLLALRRTGLSGVVQLGVKLLAVALSVLAGEGGRLARF